MLDAVHIAMATSHMKREGLTLEGKKGEIRTLNCLHSFHEPPGSLIHVPDIDPSLFSLLSYVDIIDYITGIGNAY